MMLAESMRDMYDPWVTEYRGQFNYAIPQHQEVQSLIYDYDNKYRPQPHPSSRMPNNTSEDLPPHPAGFYNNNGQFYDAYGRPCDPPPPPPLPRKRMTTKKPQEVNGRKIDTKQKGVVSRNFKGTVSEAPHFQTTKAANRHKACVDNSIASNFIMITKAINARTADVFKNVKKDVQVKKGAKQFHEPTNQGKRIYHPLNYDRSGNLKATRAIREVEPSPLAPPAPYPPPTHPTYSPFPTQNSAFHVQEAEPSPHPHPLYTIQTAPHVRQVTPSPRGPAAHPPPTNPLPPSRPPTPPPPPQPRPAFQVKEVEMSPHGNVASSPPPPPPLPPVSHTPRVPAGQRHVDYDIIAPNEVRTIVPPPAFSRDPSDKSTIPAHTCTHQWHNDSDLYWSSLPFRKAPPLECAMCFARPHPNEYTKSFDPSRWLELNPKFYKYMPAQSLRKIPAAGKAVTRSPGFSVAAMYP